MGGWQRGRHAGPGEHATSAPAAPGASTIHIFQFRVDQEQGKVNEFMPFVIKTYFNWLEMSLIVACVQDCLRSFGLKPCRKQRSSRPTTFERRSRTELRCVSRRRSSSLRASPQASRPCDECRALWRRRPWRLGLGWPSTRPRRLRWASW